MEEEEEEKEKEKVEKRFIPAHAQDIGRPLRLRSHDDDDRARRHESASFTRS